MKRFKIIGLLVLFVMAMSCMALFGCEKTPTPTPTPNPPVNNGDNGDTETGEHIYLVTLSTSNLALSANDEVTVEATAKKNGELIESPTFKIRYEKDSDGELATVTSNGAKVTAKTKQVLEAATINAYVVLEDGGKQTDGVAKLTINLIPPQKSIQQLATDYEIRDGKYYTRLMLTEGGDLPTNKALNFVARKYGEPVEGAEITWQPVQEEGYDSETCLITDDGKIKANKFGKGLLEASTTIDGEEVKVRLVCETVKKTVDLTNELRKTEIVVNKLSDGDKYLFDYSGAIGSIESLNYGETVLSSSVDGNDIIYNKQAFSGDIFGAGKVLSVESEKEIYKVKFDVVTDKISTIHEWNELVELDDKSGYYRLANDIDFDGANHKTIKGFNGTIDGDGYTLKVNLQIPKNGDIAPIDVPLFENFIGIIKNVRIEIVGGNFGAPLFDVTNAVGGTLNNVYVDINHFSKWSVPLFRGANRGNWKLDSVVVDVTDVNGLEQNMDVWADNNHWNGLFGELTNGGTSYATTAKNIVVIGAKTAKAKSRITKPTAPEVNDGTGALINAYVDGTNGVQFPVDGWDERYWTVNEVEKTVVFAKKTIMLPQIDGVSIENNTHMIDFTEYGESFGFVESVKVNNTTLNCDKDGSLDGAKYTLNGKHIIVNFGDILNTKGDNVVVIETSRCNFSLTVHFEQIIKTVADWNALASDTDKSGYYKLANDIDFGGTYPTAIEGLSGTIDGNGYSIKNTSEDPNGNEKYIFKSFAGGTVKNLAIEVTLRQNTVVFNEINNATVENVYIKLTSTKAHYGTGVIFSNVNTNYQSLTIKNLVIDVTEAQSQINGMNTYNSLLGDVVKTITLTSVKNIAIYGVPEGKYNKITKFTEAGAAQGNGSDIGVYVDGSNNGVSFPTQGWDERYWRISTVNPNLVLWRTVKETIDLGEVEGAVVVTDDNKFTLDLREYAQFVDNAKVYLNGNELSTFEIVNNQLTIDFGEGFDKQMPHDLKIEIGNYILTLIILYDRPIREIFSISDWNAIATCPDKGALYKLTGDIDFGGATHQTIKGFNGTIDGDGYTLKVNLQIPKNGEIAPINVPLFENFAGIIKNVRIEIVGGNYGAPLFKMTKAVGGMLNNVYVDINHFSKWSVPLFGGSERGNWKLDSVVIDVTDVNGLAQNMDVWAEANSWYGLFGELTNGGTSYATTAKNIVVIGAETDKAKGRITKPTSKDAYDGTGALINAYVKGSDNGVSFPTQGWDETYWTVNEVEKTVIWKQETFTVTFLDSDGVTELSTAQVVVIGDKAQIPTNPEKDNFAFAGWFNGSELFDFETPIYENLTLKAKWQDEFTKPYLPC